MNYSFAVVQYMHTSAQRQMLQTNLIWN